MFKKVEFLEYSEKKREGLILYAFLTRMASLFSPFLRQVGDQVFNHFYYGHVIGPVVIIAV